MTCIHPHQDELVHVWVPCTICGEKRCMTREMLVVD